MSEVKQLDRDRRLAILESLKSTHCEACSRFKKPMQSYCSGCYYKLPVKLRANLYLGFGAGYEEAFEESLIALKGAKS